MPGWMLDPGWSLVHRQQPHPEDLTPPLAEDQQASQVHPEDLTPPLAEDQQASLGVMLAWHQVTLASRMVSQAWHQVASRQAWHQVTLASQERALARECLRHSKSGGKPNQ